MSNGRAPLFALVIAVGTFAGPAQAELFDRGNGLIYDSDLDITWLADANYAQTSGYDADGRMTWAAAKAWAAQLSYGGFDDWRLPTTAQPDSTCSNQSAGEGFGYNCTGSEMGHLFYVELSGTAYQSVLTSGDPDLALFQNIQVSVPGETLVTYWTGTESTSLPAYAWIFSMSYGGQGMRDTINAVATWCPDAPCEYPAWAVRDGDVVVAPSELLGDLIQDVVTLNVAAGIGNALDSKLQNALDALDRARAGDTASASGILYAFIQSVEAQRGKKLTDAQADELGASAQAIIDALSQP